MKKQRITLFLKTVFCAVFLGLLTISISACNKDNSVPKYVIDPSWENLSDREHQLLWDIELSGIQVIKHGMLFKFIIPTDCFFRKDTRLLKPHREKDLDRLAEFIHNYLQYFAKPCVKVVGYTDKTYLYPANVELSLRYARIVAEYLRGDNISSLVISVKGAGAKHPIASNQYPMGTAFNRRVEVTVD